MDAILNTELENAMQCLLESYELAVMYGDEALQNTDPYLENMTKLCKIKHEAQLSEKALRLAREQRSLEDFHSVYSTELSNGKDLNVSRTNEFKAFQKRLQEIKDAANVPNSTEVIATASRSVVEDDEFVMESEINVFDPLTKLRMQDPVRNTFCGHHYEKSTILESIKINPRLKCPVAGCGNNQYIQAQHLKSDNALKLRLMKMLEAESEDPLAS